MHAIMSNRGISHQSAKGLMACPFWYNRRDSDG
jgi:hypothetical protein